MTSDWLKAMTDIRQTEATLISIGWSSVKKSNNLPVEPENPILIERCNHETAYILKFHGKQDILFYIILILLSAER